MINVTTDKSEEVQQVVYPCVGVTPSGTMVWFHAHSKGSVIAVGSKSSSFVGEHSYDWIMPNFTLYNADINIKLKDEIKGRD